MGTPHTNNYMGIGYRNMLKGPIHAQWRKMPNQRNHGAIPEIAYDEHVANIPLPHLIYGCKFEAKGKRYCVTPREQ